jgi:hypothetical protein
MDVPSVTVMLLCFEISDTEALASGNCQLWNIRKERVERLMGCKVCQSVHNHVIQINQPTKRNNFSSLLLDVYVQLNMFRASSRP